MAKRGDTTTNTKARNGLAAAALSRMKSVALEVSRSVKFCIHAAMTCHTLVNHMPGNVRQTSLTCSRTGCSMISFWLYSRQVLGLFNENLPRVHRG